MQSLAINGPLNPTGPGDTPSRRRIFSLPARDAPPRKTPCARTILSALATRALRRPVSEKRPDDRHAARVLRVGPHASRLRGRHPVRARARPRRSAVHLPVRAGAGGRCAPARSTGSAISSWPRGCPSSSGAASRTRSCCGVAATGRLADPAVLEQQTRRMLADPRAGALDRQPRRPVAAAAAARRRGAGNEGVRRQPPLRLPARDRAAVRDHRPRGSQHPRSDRRRLHVRRRAARAALRHPQRPRQPLPARRRWTTSARRGLLGHGSFLTVTSAGNRTSPVKRGKWILENLLGAPVPQPPPGVETNLDGVGRARRRADVDAPAARAAPRQPELRVLPRGDGPGRLLARALRSDRQVARRPTAARRSTPPAGSSTARRSTARPACGRRCSTAARRSSRRPRRSC